MAIEVSVSTPTALSTDSPSSVIQLTFKYTGSSQTVGNSKIFYAASLNDGTNTEDVVIPYTIAGSAPYMIPSADQPFAFTPKKITGDTVTLVAGTGAIFYTPVS